MYTMNKQIIIVFYSCPVYIHGYSLPWPRSEAGYPIKLNIALVLSHSHSNRV